MNISRKIRLSFVIGIAILFILYGVSGLIFKFRVDKKIENYISTALMFIAAFIIFAGRKKHDAANQSDETEKENNDKKQSGG